MFRILLIMVLGVLVFAVSPADAQRLRRWFPQANFGRAYQRQQQPNYGYRQTQDNPACQPQSRLQTRQQRFPRQSQVRDYRAGANYSRNIRAATNQQQLTARQNAARPDSTGGQQAGQQQRYSVYYDPRTKQRIVRPVPPADSRTAGSPTQGNLRRQTTVQGQAYLTPTVTQNQFDLARQPVTDAATQPTTRLSLNPPQPTVATPNEIDKQVVSSSFAEPVTATTTTRDTIEPKNESATKSESASPQKAFSILESGDSDEPNGRDSSQNGSDSKSN